MIKKIRQNNFTNLNLETIGSQLNRIENQVNQIRERQDSKEEIYPAIVRPPLPVTNFKLRNPNKNKELVDELTNRLKQNLSINMISGDLIENSDTSDIEKMEAAFLDAQQPSINKVTYPSKNYHFSGVDRYYYPRPTPQDIPFEEIFFRN